MRSTGKNKYYVSYILLGAYYTRYGTSILEKIIEFPKITENSLNDLEAVCLEDAKLRCIVPECVHGVQIISWSRFDEC